MVVVKPRANNTSGALRVQPRRGGARGGGVGHSQATLMIHLLTAATPNGQKVSILLEELALPYEVQAIDLQAKEQKQDWFLRLNPIGRIPVIVADRGSDDFEVFVSWRDSPGIWLKRSGRLLPTNAKERSVVMQWIMFQKAGLGPMMGQANVFYRYAPEKIRVAIGPLSQG